MRRFTVAIFTVILLPSVIAHCYANLVVSAQQTPTYYVRVGNIDYPSEVPINFTFRISVVVNYSFPMLSGYSALPALWLITARFYNSTGNAVEPSVQTLLGTSDVEQVRNKGTHTFYTTIQAPSYPTTIHVTVYAMFQPLPPYVGSYLPSGLKTDEWSYTHGTDSMVEISINIVQNADVYLSTNKPSIPVTIDGYQQVKTDSSGHLTVKLAVLRWHFIAVPDVVGVGSGVREVFVSWQDGSNSTLLSLYLRSTAYLNLTYKTQFLLTVKGNEGSGWYDESSYAELHAVSERQANGLLGMIGFNEVFSGWSGDLHTHSPTVRVLMDGPHQMVAEWVTRYEPRGVRIVLTIAIVIMIICLWVFARKRKATKV